MAAALALLPLSACEGAPPDGAGANLEARNGAALATADAGPRSAAAGDAGAAPAGDASGRGVPGPADAAGAGASMGDGFAANADVALGDDAAATLDSSGGDSGLATPTGDALVGLDPGPAMGGPGAACMKLAQCGPGLTCKREGCATAGWCVPAPGGCPAVAYPVCDCDGATHPSPCDLLAAGVGKKHDGPCANSACQGGGNTCGPLAWCAAPCGGVGTCKAKPTTCGKDLAPVCGCNGKDYVNACLAALAGSGVAKEGTCLASAACLPGSNDAACLCKVGTEAACGASAWCSAAKAGGCGGVGLCVPKPKACADFAKPVCGCDGVTYSNACAAGSAGVNVAAEGPCKADKACNIGAATCPVGTFCKAVGDFQCGGAGACVTLPQMCQSLLLPVCGCDGKTYSNACTTTAAGINIAAKGECSGAATGATCQTAASCPPGQGCKNAMCQACKNVACPAVACQEGKQMDPCTCQCFSMAP